ncbi:hypothetical protein [Marinobacterium aestuariivivens]|uniref:Uncharacterized protein n=1 Tax=Marinobacterium aestuariivivens TaxID=1698799 RepID=A0ABW1ZWQ6_9GAMM
MLGINRGIDNVQKAAGDPVGSGRPDQPELASGREPDAVIEASEAGNHAAPKTQVVDQAREVLGNLIDTHA